MSKNIIFLSTYPPRACGIATFTADLIKNLKNKFPSDNYKIAAINDENYKYGNEVSFVLNQFDRKSYIRLANSINNSNTDLVVIEHEYGIYGGDCGEYLLDFINNLKIPFITTLHTILSKPNKNQREILKVLGSKSKKIITMGENSIGILNQVYDIPENKIAVIPHGVPDIAVESKKTLKEKLDCKGRNVISTFGLLDPGKGIEYAIEAISQVVETHPKVLYLILGETHPCVRKAHGESYRTKLQNLVSELHIEDNVRFVNKYLTKKEIVQYLTLSDIYVTPYLATEQAVSGTLAYAAGYGKVIVSTPYRYAKEMLKDGRGMLAKSKDSSSLAKAILYLLNNPTARKSMEKKMFNTGKKMKWPYVAQQYENLFSNTIKTSKITKQVV
ncbi:MAG TPA: glycosyl transferase family 1 [Clostridium sp.]|uniref:Glycosyltransferase family 4 protein n=1 Tax=Clostridium lapidicellarium TaxID=3240931 RepID=A0ABV4DYK0_9CLOT|nr:glycosyltransferase family 4 protein [uncultured Clostridium sp.]NLU08214.1 glycosyltransferase [Clostridiales bacterium]HBC98050.1 glycosyl transferase family 1 [Clostridium sp.]